jgi:hypothetical protein
MMRTEQTDSEVIQERESLQYVGTFYTWARFKCAALAS